MIASIFNGPGERLNLLPMNGNLNKGAWKRMENQWASALKEGKSVGVKIEPVYAGGSVRPEEFTVTYQIGSERPIIETFVHSAGGRSKSSIRFISSSSGMKGIPPFRGDILDQPACEWTRDDLVETLGPPDSQGGDKMDGLLGYIRPWVRYKKFGSALHAEFSQDGRLWKFTLMLS